MPKETEPPEEDENENENEGEDGNKDDKPLDDAAPQPPDPPAPDNLKNPDVKKIKEDRKMALEGKLPERKFVVKRIEPQKVRHPQYGFSIICYNQRRDWCGQYTDAEVEEFATKYFGGGHFQTISHSLEGKLLGRRTFANPGDPNMDNVIADCCTSEQIAKYKEALAAPPNKNQPQAASAPAAPAVSEDPMSLAQKEILGMKAEVAVKAARVEKEKAEAEIYEQQRELRNAKYGFRPPHRRDYRPDGSVVEDDRFAPPPKPVDELEKPLTAKDMLFNKLDALNSQFAMIHNRPSEPKTNMAETIAALIAAAAPILTEVIKISAENQRAQTESQRELMKTILDSGKQSDKQVEMLMQALGLRDQRQANSSKEMIELIKLGGELSGGNNSGSWVSDIGQALGDIAGGVAGAITAAKQQQRPGLPQQMVRQPVPQVGPRPVPVGPSAPRALPAPVAGPRGVPVQRAGNPAPVAPRPLPVPPVQAPPEPVPASEDDSMTDDDMRRLATEVLTSVLQEADHKPSSPQWVTIAYNGLPTDLLKEIAGAPDSEKLIEIFQPYANFSMLMAIGNKIKSDPSVESWLRAGFASLQQMAREELGVEPEPEPVTDDVPKPIQSEGPADIKDQEDE